jgi:hypothetical protein
VILGLKHFITLQAKALFSGPGNWRKLHNEELYNLYSSPSIIRMIKSRRMRWAGHVAGTGRRGMHVGYWCGSHKERDY